jgi:hypothetical protein
MERIWICAAISVSWISRVPSPLVLAVLNGG